MPTYPAVRSLTASEKGTSYYVVKVSVSVKRVPSLNKLKKDLYHFHLFFVLHLLHLCAAHWLHT